MCEQDSSYVTIDVYRAMKRERDELATALHLSHRCHACGANTPPPRPYSLYVTCEKCGKTTAATAAFQPETSFARLIAEKQAEAIHRLHNRYLNEAGGNGSISGFVWEELSKLRSQTQEPA